MRQTPELQAVQERMKPGVLTLGGFLGTDHRPLADILREDDETVKRHGVTHGEIAAALDRFAIEGQDLMEGPVIVDGRYQVRVRDDRGVLPSPWGDGNFPKGDVELLDTQTGTAFRWNGLTAHLIRAHGFYGGKGSDYRIDPDTIIHCLGLPGQSAAD